MTETLPMIERIFAFSRAVRYVAIYRDGELETKARQDLEGASSAESDRYEELIVNPTLLKLTAQRGEIDCGGLDYVIVRYGNFFQVVVPAPWGHLSVCVEGHAEPTRVANEVKLLATGAA